LGIKMDIKDFEVIKCDIGEWGGEEGLPILESLRRIFVIDLE